MGGGTLGGASNRTTEATISSEAMLFDALDRLEPVAGQQAARARAELDHTLSGLRSSAVGELAWSSSCLTPSRFPLELAVTSKSNELRTVVDVLAPEVDRTTALREAIAVAELLGSTGLDPQMMTLLRSHQRHTDLRFGAWLGSRHRIDGTTHKVYVELSGDAASTWTLLDQIAPDARRVIGGMGRVSFLGCHLDGTGAIEIYLRANRLNPELLQACAGRSRIAGAGTALVDAMNSNNARVGSGDFDGPNHGLSVAYLGPELVALAAFSFAHHRFGRDHRVRVAVLRQARSGNWPSTHIYQALSAPLSESCPSPRPVHSAISHVANVNATQVEHHVGLAPAPPAAQTEQLVSLPIQLLKE